MKHVTRPPSAIRRPTGSANENAPPRKMNAASRSTTRPGDRSATAPRSATRSASALRCRPAAEAKDDMAALQTEIAELKARVKKTEACAAELREGNAALSTEWVEQTSKLTESRRTVDRALLSSEGMRGAALKTLQGLSTEHDRVTAHLRTYVTMLDVSCRRKKQLENSTAAMESEHDTLHEEKNTRHWASMARLMLAIQFQMALREFDANTADIARFRSQMERQRKLLFNIRQRLKGNIRVYCRVRPALAKEKGQTVAGLQVSDSAVRLDVQKASVSGPSIAGFDFEFDRVFDASSSQVQVFEEISQLVLSAMDGFHVCVFAYGQTSSGKTHTMLGPTGCPGIIPRTIDLVFRTVTSMEARGYQYELTCTCFEVYNDVLNDLLSESSSLDIKMNGDGNPVVTGCEVRPVKTTRDVQDVVLAMLRERTTASTAANEHSSRSHALLQLHIRGGSTEHSLCSTLSLVDLAGSERVKGATGTRLRETQNINKSLSALGDVIYGLADRKAGEHIPYRNSKLTMLLKESLCKAWVHWHIGGDAKTALFVNVSGLATHEQETLNTFRFSSKVNRVSQRGAKRR